MQDEEFQKKLKTAIFIFVIVSACTGFYTGIIDAVQSNYFKDAYDATAQQRGLIEIPRELPGVVSLFVITAFSFLRDIRTAVIAQVFGIIGMVVLGLFHPSFGIMLIFLFIFSLGQHMSIPLSDSIGLSLATRDNMGRVLGRFNSIRMAFMMIAGLVCFFGFRSDLFHFCRRVRHKEGRCYRLDQDIPHSICSKTEATGNVIIEKSVVMNVISAALFAFPPYCAVIGESAAADGNNAFRSTIESHRTGMSNG